MFSSMGYHTFAISMGLTQAEADMLLNDFKKYRDCTGEIYIEQKKYEIDPMGRHIEIKYLNQHKGIVWKIRNKTIRPGSYYTYNRAKRIIEDRVVKWEKIIRLNDTMKLICSSGGIAKAGLYGKDLEDFRRSLRELVDLGINPVTIPEEWGITYMPNLLDAYYDKISEEQAKEWLNE